MPEFADMPPAEQRAFARAQVMRWLRIRRRLDRLAEARTPAEREAIAAEHAADLRRHAVCAVEGGETGREPLPPGAPDA